MHHTDRQQDARATRPRVLLVSHSYVHPGYWDKLEALGRCVDLAVVVPTSWPQGLHPVANAPQPGKDASWRHYCVRGHWSGYHYRYFFDPVQLGQVLADVRPEIVHVEQELESLSLLQLSILKPFYGYKLIFFVWENHNRVISGRLLAWANLLMSDAGIVGNSGSLRRCRRLGFRKPLEVIPQYGFTVQARQQALPRAERRFLVGFAGRLVPEKGLLVLAEAVRRLPGMQLVVAGGGPLEDELRREPEIKVLGVLDRQTMARFWEQIDVLVLPSLSTTVWREQFGRVLAEAMAAGVPVVGSDSGAIPEVVGDAGLVVPEGDAAALAEVLLLLQRRPELRTALGWRGRDRVEREYSHAVITAKIAALYRKVLRDVPAGTFPVPAEGCRADEPARAKTPSDDLCREICEEVWLSQS